MMTESTEENQALRELVDVLRGELNAAHDRERRAQEVEVLRLRTLDQAQERLAQAQKQFEEWAQERAIDVLDDPPRDMRRRIVALLEGKPEGLSRKAIERGLGVQKNLSDTLTGMIKAGGPLVRPSPGRYAVGARQPEEQGRNG